MSDLLTIGTRGSKLALAQAETVAGLLRAAHSGLRVELRVIQTTGDRVLDRALSAIGDKGLFVKEIEAALLAEEIDMAVHSAKDLPSETPSALLLAAFPERADPRDALISRSGLGLEGLPQGSSVGTSSLRRSAQLRALRPDLRIELLRGNVDTRLRKLSEGRYDAIVLAVAGLQRLGLQQAIVEALDPAIMVPAVAQGALALECRAGDQRTRALLQALDHQPTRTAVLAERAFLRRLEGGCQLPMGAYATLEPGGLLLRGMLGQVDGPRVARAELSGPAAEPEALGIAVADMLRELIGHTD